MAEYLPPTSLTRFHSSRLGRRRIPFETRINRKRERFFPVNAVITNGTLKLPEWQDVLFGVSVDGTEKIYTKIRGQSINNQYQVVRQNIIKGLADGNKVFVLMTIHKLNEAVIEEFTSDWLKVGVKGLIFDFYTPQKDDYDDPIWVPLKERDVIIERLRKLRKKYGERLPWNTPAVLENMSSRHCLASTTACRQKGLREKPSSLKLNFKGKRMYPCIMGAENLKQATIDCSRCGCIFAYPQDKRALWSSLKTVLLTS